MATADLMNILQQTGGLSAIASQLGISPEMAEAGAGALLPAVVGGFNKQAQSHGRGEAGLGGLVDILGSLGGGGLADNVLGPEPTEIDKGNDVLGQIFGSKDVSRTVAGQAANKTGIDPSILKKMLPLLAMLVAGYLSKQAEGGRQGGRQAQGGGLLGGLLGSVLGGLLGGGGTKRSRGGNSGGGLGGLGQLIDLDGDGNPLDDILGMAAKLGR